MKNKHRVNLNAYLFANLVILCLLLIGIWNKKPVWDTSIRFPNLLLVLVIINTVLIFKDFILGTTPAKTGKVSKKRKLIGLNKVREVIDGFDEPSEKYLEATLKKMCELSGANGMLLLAKEKDYYKTITKTDNLPAVLPGIKFVLQNKILTAKYPGNLGSEKIGEMTSYRQREFDFSSKVTRFDAIIIPLWLRGGIPGLWIISGQKKQIRLSLSSAAFALEMAYALNHDFNNCGKGRYKDVETGLLLNECFDDSFETEIERAERYQQEMSLLSLKITNFDDIADESKSPVLGAVAKALKESLRRLDLMFCGKSKIEFMAILTETNIESAAIVAGRIQKLFQKEVRKIDSDLNVVLNIGVASYPADATHGSGLKEKSLEALSEAISENSDYFKYSKFKERT